MALLLSYRGPVQGSKQDSCALCFGYHRGFFWLKSQFGIIWTEMWSKCMTIPYRLKHPPKNQNATILLCVLFFSPIFDRQIWRGNLRPLLFLKHINQVSTAKCMEDTEWWKF